MHSLVPVGRVFFALALIGLGVEHFVFREFVTGRAPAWPESVPGGMMWAFFTGAALVALNLAILLRKRAQLAALLVAALIFGWALLRHLPVLTDVAFLSPAWTEAGKALTFFGGALVVAATLPNAAGSEAVPESRGTRLWDVFLVLGRVCLGVFLIITGFQHFEFTEFVASLIPGWFPGDAVFWTYFAGVALITGGVGLMVPPTARLAALLSGLMVFSWFWIIHVPRTFTSVSDGIAVFEALAVSGIAFVLAGYRGRETERRPAGVPPLDRDDVALPTAQVTERG